MEYRDISNTTTEECSAAIRDRMGRTARAAAGAFSLRRLKGPRQIKQHCKLSDELQELIRVAMTKLNLTPWLSDAG